MRIARVLLLAAGGEPGEGDCDRGEASASDVIPLRAFPSPLPKLASASTDPAQTLPGTRRQYSAAELRGRAVAIDWFPSEHPPMPAAVQGKAGGADACAYCHLPNASSRPENSSLAGLPRAYLLEQVRDIQAGTRLPLPHFTAAQRMLEATKQTSESAVQAAARYYSELRFVKRVRVVEKLTVPHFTVNSVYLFDHDGPRELLNERIVEGPDDNFRFAMRVDRATYTAYVPVGAASRGAELARGEGAARTPCHSCHGRGLKGGAAPPLAGRSPTVIFRQLYAFQHEFRRGKNAAAMTAVLAAHTLKDMIDLSAYAASLSP